MMWESRAGAGTLVVRDGRVLMVLRERSGNVRWELAFGLLKGDETFEEAAARETLEETSLKVEIGQIALHGGDGRPCRALQGHQRLFLAIAKDNGTPRPVSFDKPIQRAEFVDTLQLPSRDLHPVDRRILSRWRRKPAGKPFYFRI
jgi:ADP-ribose pyrophosphatase YjhB (NUDIX family)